MARARNIKPSFFTNDELAELEPLARLFFISLWTLADYKGCIIWRDKRIKVQTLPYDNCDISRLAINLDKSGFIRFYSDSENIYLKVVNFSCHQNPHKNEREKGSDIPDYSDSMREIIDFKGNKIISRFIAINPDKNGSDRADSLNLIPDSLNLIPDDSSEQAQEQQSAFELPLNDNSLHTIFDIEINEWSELYQNVDIIQELRKMKGWLNANPRRRKTKTGINKFINNWLSKEQDKGGIDGQNIRQNTSRSAKVAETVRNIGRRDIEENGFTDKLD